MKLSMVDRTGEMNDELQELASRRMHFALARFDSKIDHVSLVISDVNGPRGGVDKRCTVSLKMKNLGEITTSWEDETVEISVSKVAERSRRAVARAIQRSQQFQRVRHADLRLP